LKTLDGKGVAMVKPFVFRFESPLGLPTMRAIQGFITGALSDHRIKLALASGPPDLAMRRSPHVSGSTIP
jgi:hypothetical protein